MKTNIEVSIAAAVACAATALLWTAPARADQPDAWITTKAKMALLTDAEAPALDVNVDTVDGRVTLEGEVASEAEKARAEKVVRALDGVRDVRNMLRVDASADDGSDAARSAKVADDEIEKRVEAALDKDAALSKSDIEVKSVDAGIVTLGGKARTMTEHRRALERTREVAGVAGVRTDVEAPGELADAEVWGKDADEDDEDAAVKEGADAERDASSAAKDMWITTATKVRLMANDQAPALDINVDTREGEVTLFGTVPSEAAKQAAAAEAKKVDGVKAVDNRLEVVPEKMQEKVAAQDGELEAAVERKLGERADLEDADIDVEVSNGVARLTGNVDSQSDRLRALTTARGVAGVRSAVDDMEVEAETDSEASKSSDADSNAAADADARRETTEGNRPAADAYDDDAHNDAGDAPLR